MSATQIPEPWLRGTLAEMPAVFRAVLHALELAKEDIARWCEGLTDEAVERTPGWNRTCSIPRAPHCSEHRQAADIRRGPASSTTDQIAALKTELESGATRRELFSEFTDALMTPRREFARSHSVAAGRGEEGRKTRVADDYRRPAGSRGRSHATARGAGRYDCENCGDAGQLAASLTRLTNDGSFLIQQTARPRSSPPAPSWTTFRW